MTEREWLNGLSDEEFAKKLMDSCSKCDDNDIENCYDGHLKWLKQEHEDKLKTCPFCGSKHVKIGVNHGFFYAMCNNCCACTTVCVSRELAIKNWNTRVGESND